MCLLPASSILYALLIQFDLTFCFLRKVGKSWKFCKLHLRSEERFGDFCEILAVESPLEPCTGILWKSEFYCCTEVETFLESFKSFSVLPQITSSRSSTINAPILVIVLALTIIPLFNWTLEKKRWQPYRTKEQPVIFLLCENMVKTITIKGF